MKTINKYKIISYYSERILRAPLLPAVALLVVLIAAAPAACQQTYVQPAVPQAAPGAYLQPGQDWVKDEIDLKFLPEREVVALANDLTMALRLQYGQITTFHSSLLIYASPQDIASMKNMVAQRDVAPNHIVFEATLIRVDTDKAKELGTQLSHYYSDAKADKVHTITSTTDYGLVGPFADTVIWQFTQGNSIFKMTTGYLLENDAAEVVSKPQLRVRDGGSAYFQMGQSVPQKTVSQNGTMVEYKPTGISITVREAFIIHEPTPSLSWEDENYIQNLVWASIEVTDGSVGNTTSEGIVTNDTKVMTEGYFVSGDTYIIASLIKDNNKDRVAFTPGLHRLPFVGKFFKEKTSSTTHSETIILMRPTVETKMTQQLLASHFDTSLDLLPMHLGGRNRDSINVHPFSDAMWKGVPEIYPEIYDKKGCLNGTYWELLDYYNDKDIENLGKEFKKVRARVGLILGQSKEQLKMQIFQDTGIEQTVQEALDDFAAKTGKRRPTAQEMIVAAAHEGVLNEWAYHTYLERLGIKKTCSNATEDKGNAAGNGANNKTQ